MPSIPLPQSIKLGGGYNSCWIEEARMKKLLVLVTIMVFAMAVPFAVAQTDKKADKVDKKINCCIKGECQEMTKAECKKEKGKVVADCKKCKAAKPSKTSPQ
jgi:hypothetical protein